MAETNVDRLALDPAGSWVGFVNLQGWAGLTRQSVRIVGETPQRYRIEAIERTKLAGRNRWLDPGQRALVPKRAITRV